MILDQIKYLLKSRTGMHIPTVGNAVLETAIQTRCRVLEINETIDYLLLLQRSDAELTELIEEVVIPETWFFRDRHPFDTLTNLAKDALSANNNFFWRILSIPSSTGEEPYSIAMTLLMAGMKPEQFSIEGIDISQRALDRARAGYYGPHSFRGAQDARVRQRYFDDMDKAWLIKPEIRDLVRFERANLLDTQFRTGREYDIIFCRNLLIYFDADDKKIAYKTIHQLLSDEGYLFIGHSEGGAIPDCFTNTGHTGAFAYQKSIRNGEADDMSAGTKLTQTSISTGISTAAIQTETERNVIKEDLQSAATATAETEQDQESPLELARKYADAGNLVDAEHICEAYLNEHEQDASAYYLLGLIQEAGDTTDLAEKSYRKALYLDPHYRDALIHLSLLLEQQGKTRQAQQLRQRAERQQEKSA